MNIKDTVALIIGREVSAAEDNLYRAERQFQNMTSEGMKAPYGQSGKSCQEILDNYKNAAADAQLQLDWVHSREA